MPVGRERTLLWSMDAAIQKMSNMINSVNAIYVHAFSSHQHCNNLLQRITMRMILGKILITTMLRARMHELPSASTPTGARTGRQGTLRMLGRGALFGTSPNPKETRWALDRSVTLADLGYPNAFSILLSISSDALKKLNSKPCQLHIIV